VTRRRKRGKGVEVGGNALDTRSVSARTSYFICLSSRSGISRWPGSEGAVKNKGKDYKGEKKKTSERGDNRQVLSGRLNERARRKDW